MINHCPLFCNVLAGSDRLAMMVEIILLLQLYQDGVYNNEFNTPVLKCCLFVHVTVSMNFLLF